MANLTVTDVMEAYALLSLLPAAKTLNDATSAALVEVYRSEGVSGPELREAAAWAAKTQEFWPAPARLLGRIREGRARLGGAEPETAEEAWGHVRRLMTTGWQGAGVPGELSQKARAAFSSALGPSWEAFWATAMSSDMVSHRSRFVDAYRSAAAVDRSLLEHERQKREFVPVEGLPSELRALPYDPKTVS